MKFRVERLYDVKILDQHIEKVRKDLLKYFTKTEDAAVQEEEAETELVDTCTRLADVGESMGAIRFAQYEYPTDEGTKLSDPTWLDSNQWHESDQVIAGPIDYNVEEVDSDHYWVES